MRPPANRNFVQETKEAAHPRTPIFYIPQQRFNIPPISMRWVAPDTVSQMGCIPQPQTKNVSLRLIEVNNMRRVYRGSSGSFNKSRAVAIPLNSITGIGADLSSRINRGNYDPKQRGLAVTSF